MINYKANDNIRAFIQKTAALSIVPIAFVKIAWNAIKQVCLKVHKYKSIMITCNVFWSIKGNFRLQMWNYFSYTGTCMNNHLEGWHNRIKKIARKSQPNIYELIEILQKDTNCSKGHNYIRQLEGCSIIRCKVIC